MVQPKSNNKERHQIQTTARKKKNHFVSANIQVAITKCHRIGAAKRMYKTIVAITKCHHIGAAKRMYKTMYCMICGRTYKQQKLIERILIMP